MEMDITEHQYLPLPTGSVFLDYSQVNNLVKDFQCFVCCEIPEFKDFLETPCCNRVVHPACVTKQTSKSIGEDRNARHMCGYCRFGENAGEVFSTRSLKSSRHKAALAAAFLESPRVWNEIEGVDLQEMQRRYLENTRMMREKAAQDRKEYDGKVEEAARQKEEAAARQKEEAARQKEAQLKALERAKHLAQKAEKRASGVTSVAIGKKPKVTANSGVTSGGGLIKKDPPQTVPRVSLAAPTSHGDPTAHPLEQEWTREWTPSVEALIAGVAVLCLRPHSHPPPETCHPQPLPMLPEDQIVVSARPALTDLEIRTYIEYYLRLADGTLPADAPYAGKQQSQSSRTAESGHTDSTLGEKNSESSDTLKDDVVVWGDHSPGQRIALYICLDDRGARCAPPGESRRWPADKSLAEILLDVSLWDVEKLEDDVLVLYYALVK